MCIRTVLLCVRYITMTREAYLVWSVTAQIRLLQQWIYDRRTVSVHVAVPLANNGVSRMINVSVIPATPFKKKKLKKKLFSAWNDVQCNDVDVWTLWARQCRSERCAAPRGFALVVHLCVSVRDEVPGFIMCICSSTVSVRNKLCIWNFAATCVCLFVYLIDWAAE